MLCLLCAAPLETGSAALCSGCHADLPHLEAACLRCARPCRTELCGACAVRPPPYDRVIACFEYRLPVDFIIHEFKYSGRLWWAEFLAGRMEAAIRRAAAPLPDRVVPVPLHWRRRWQRGYNQSAELARIVGAKLGIPVDCGLVRRSRATETQAALPAAERGGNVRGAFTARRRVTGARIAIVDDVVTTGATAAELSRVLLRAGAAGIQVWAVASAG